MRDWVFTGSPEHQAQCKHSLINPVANTCTNCFKDLGPSMPEQIANMRQQIHELEIVVGMLLAAGRDQRLEADQEHARAMIWARNAEGRKG